MKTPPEKRPVLSRARGFTLILTISMMVLLAMVAIGLLSLSSLTMRAGATSKSHDLARANARLAMMLAIGDLQRHAGTDQSITARAGILDENVNQNQWTGVWKNAAGSSNDPFWLISGNRGATGLDPRSASSAGMVELVTKRNDNDPVQVPLVQWSDTRNVSRMGWWVADESTKAAVDVEKNKRTGTDKESYVRASMALENGWRANFNGKRNWLRSAA